MVRPPSFVAFRLTGLFGGSFPGSSGRPVAGGGSVQGRLRECVCRVLAFRVAGVSKPVVVGRGWFLCAGGVSSERRAFGGCLGTRRR